jgi:hypothetical protein
MLLSACTQVTPSPEDTPTANVPSIEIPSLKSPSERTVDSQPVYKWSKIANAIKYQIQVYLGSNRIVNEVVTTDAGCSGGTCSFDPGITLVNGSYQWRVRAYAADEWKDYSDFTSFVHDEFIVDLGKMSFNLEDCISSWWIHPLAKRHVDLQDKTYLGYTDSQGYSGVASIDNRTGQIIKTRLMRNSSADDHNAAAVDILPDGRIIAAYAGGHNTSTTMAIRISTRRENIEEFGEEILIETGKHVSYAQLYQKNNRYWLFFRLDKTNWAYASSADGSFWDAPVEIITSDVQYYVKIADTSDDSLLRLVMYSHPNVGDTNIRLGFFDTQTREVKLADGTVLGTQGVSKDLFPIILPVEENKNNRLLDVAVTDPGLTVMAYAEFTDSSDAAYKIAYFQDSLKIASLINAGQSFYEYSVYVGGVAFGYNPDTVFLSREEDGIWYIEKWQTSDQTLFVKTEFIHQSALGQVAIRPILELEGDKLIWQEGYYNPDSYSDFYTNYQYIKVRDIPAATPAQ